MLQGLTTRVSHPYRYEIDCRSLLVPIVANDVVWEVSEFGKWLPNLQLVPSQPAVPLRNYCKEKPISWGALRNQILATMIRYVDDAARILPPPPPATFSLAVSGGTGSGSYPAATSVKISAGPAPDGQVFDHWEGAMVATQFLRPPLS